MRFAITQLSDLHFTADKNTIQPKVRPLGAAICSADPTCKEYIIVLSGDIAYQGLAAEYEIALSFLKDLAATITEYKPQANVRYITVPGNHDCHLPKSELNLRAALVGAIETTLQTATPDNSILDSILGAQQNYSEFSDKLMVPAKDRFQRLYDTRSLTIGDSVIRFDLYNTALLSTRHEQQGTLSVPIEVIRAAAPLGTGCELVVSVFHHPYPWLKADVGIAFRDHVERSSEIVLTGHQHFDHTYVKQSLKGDHTLYSEGEVLQEAKAPERSGFLLIAVDTKERLRKIVSFKWATSRYTVVEETDWLRYSRAASQLMYPNPSPKFLDFLSDSGIGLTHSSKGLVPLDIVFVYPDVTTSSLTDADVQKDIRGDNLLKYISDKGRIVVRGSPYNGKTSLAKTLIKEWLRTRVFYPLFVSGVQIKHADEASIDRLINGSVTEAYGANGTELYRQLPSSTKAIVIDDWDDSPLSQANNNRFLQALLQRFDKVVLFVRGISYIQYILAKVKGTEAILQFDLVSLKELSHVGRGELIERWLSLELSRDDKEFSRRVEETERLVQSVIGKNTLPSLPLIVLAILEAAQRSTDILPENGAFGYLYEVLITSALNATSGSKPQLEKKYTFLSILAFHLFDRGTDMLSENDVNKLLDEYARSFKVKVEKTSLLTDLEKTHVLVKLDGNYSFGYAHYFYYFLARYFKMNISGVEAPRLRALLKSIAGGLNAGTNSIFLMFFIYLTHDDELIDDCLRIGNKILAELAPSDLTGEVEFYNSKDFAGIERQVPKSVDLEASRRERRSVADAVRPEAEDTGGTGLHELSVVEGEGYAEDLPLATKCQYAISCIEILGQILRNFTGSLPGDRKLEILRTTYLLGLRLLRAMLMTLSDATVRAREEIAQRDTSKPDERQFVKRFEKLLTVIGQIVGTSMIQNISMNIGSPDIEEGAYSETLDKVGRNNATQLVDLSIRLDHFQDYPYNQIKALNKEYASNRFAQRVLRDLVIANMHVFDIGHDTRQRVSALLDLGKPTDALISRTGKRLK
jgi:hypothetical protein